MDKEHIKKRIKELGPWYHNINLDGVETKKVSPPPKTPKWLMTHPKKRWEIIKKFLSEEGGSVVDLGCNAGGISFRLEERGYEVTGVEVDDRLYEQALLSKEVRDSEVKFVQEDAVKFLEKSPVFDYSVALGLVYHLEKPGKFIELLGEKTGKQLLIESKIDLERKEGKIWNEEERGDIWDFSKKWLIKEVKRTGISYIFTVRRGEKGFPFRGFRFLIAGRFE